MDCKSLELLTLWLERETGRQFTLIEAGRGVVWLVSTEHRAACSLSTEDFARRFAPESPAKAPREDEGLCSDTSGSA